MHSSADDRQVAALAYIFSLVGAVFFGAGWIVALVMWAMSRGQGTYRSDHAAQAFAIQAATFLTGMLAVVCFFTIVLIPVSFVLVLAAIVMSILFSVHGIQASQAGRSYTVPVVGPMIRSLMR